MILKSHCGANLKRYLVRLRWICSNNVVVVAIFLSPACVGEALLKSVLLLVPLEFRVCCSPWLGYGLTSEWANEVSVRMATAVSPFWAIGVESYLPT